MLEAFGLSPDQLAAVVQNFNRNLSGGTLTEMGIRYTIRGVGRLTSVEDIRNLVVAYKTQAAAAGQPAKRTPVHLRDVADVGIVPSEPENIVRWNGRPAVALDIFKEAGANTTAASQSIREALFSLQRSLPGYRIDLVQDQAGFIRAAVGEVEQAGLLGGCLAVLVLFFFLRRLRVTAVIGLAIPISVVATFNLMYFNNLTLNIMTLGGLALGLGMLVDNAIVVGENIFRHLERGLPVEEAAVRGSGEVGAAITSATLTTIVVFLPIVYLHGIAGELFKDQARTVAFALVSSLLAAMTVIPMLYSRLIPRRTAPRRRASLAFPFYGKVLEAVLRRRWAVALAALASVAAAAFGLRFIGSEFMPQQLPNELVINLKLPEGTGLERTDGTVRTIEALIRDKGGDLVESVFARAGPAGTAQSAAEALEDENNAVLRVGFKKNLRSAFRAFIAGLEKDLGTIPDLEVRFVRQQSTLQAALGTTGSPLIIEVKGKDLDVLTALADEIKANIAALPELANVETSFQGGRPEINLEVDKLQASRYGLRADTIGNQVKAVLSGTALGELEDRGEYLNIFLRNPKVSVGRLKDIVLSGSGGLRVPLSEVARLVKAASPREIIRRNQTRVAEVRAELAGDLPFNRVVAKAREAVRGTALPEGYALSITGEEILRREAFKNLKLALLLAVLLVYMVMAAQFESLLHPFVVLLTIPLAGVGSVALMLAAGVPFNVMSIIGLIMLAGIAVNNAIILVDLINRNRRAGLGLDEAIVSAGLARIRPILMTSLTTVLALCPLMLGFGEGASLRAPMAVAVTGGLVSSTALTLLVIPAVYRIIGGRPPKRAEDGA
ncbi:MAG: efflux RND transporter permease subunit [Candidatus Aminicenantes bacterium]|nr:efflux RND transporter permease subunit [Candidatus Aminicenantes bacterium]